MEQQYRITITPNKDITPLLGSKTLFSDLITQVADIMNRGMILSKIDINLDLIVPPGVEPLPMGECRRNSDGTKIFVPSPTEYLRSALLQMLPPIAEERKICDIDDPDGWFQELMKLFTKYDPDLKPEEITVDNINNFFRTFYLYFYIYVTEGKCSLLQFDHNWHLIK